MSQRHRAAAFARWRKKRAHDQMVWWLEYAATNARNKAGDYAAAAAKADHPPYAASLTNMAAANIDAYGMLLELAEDVRDGNWPPRDAFTRPMTRAVPADVQEGFTEEDEQGCE